MRGQGQRASGHGVAVLQRFSALATASTSGRRSTVTSGGARSPHPSSTSVVLPRCWASPLAISSDWWPNDVSRISRSGASFASTEPSLTYGWTSNGGKFAPRFAVAEPGDRVMAFQVAWSLVLVCAAFQTPSAFASHKHIRLGRERIGHGKT